ncbi:D-2-hydroxyacid dehydrogenase [Kineococcus sp. SYSU DK003]|uniref:D-2-hydroxyacid dehydrogenase n=1 Tax=Kineococcus sp. SYSU DK003 TaxID=3383124 RepID=UPI003D7C7373
MTLVEVTGNRSEQERERIRRIVEAVPGARVEFPKAGGPARASVDGQLRWLHSWAAGVDGEEFARDPSLLPDGVVVTSSTGNGAVPLAEHAMMLTLMLNRDAPAWMAAQRAHRWERRTHPELLGSTMGILGLGHAGRELAVRAAAFGMRVVGLSRRGTAVPGVDAVHTPDDLDRFLTGLDVLVVCAPATPASRGMLGDAQFALLNRGAHYVCISRGGIADDDALLRALRSGQVGAAGLDAHTVEPLPPDSPFWKEPHVIVTPHNGATTPGTAARGLDIFCDNLERFLGGEPLRNVVDFAHGY